MRSIFLAVFSFFIFSSLGISAFAQDASAPTPPQAAKFEITGSVHTGKTPLPGVTVTAANTLTGKKYSVATSPNGTYRIAGLPRGRYVVRVEFLAFGDQTQEVVLNPQSPAGKFDAELTLASKEQRQENNRNQGEVAARRGGFQSLSLENTEGAEADNTLGDAQGPGGNDLSGLPMNGLGAEGATDSVNVSGAQGRTQDFGGGSPEDLEQRMQDFRDRAQREGFGGPGGGGFGGGGKFGGGGGGFGGGEGGGRGLFAIGRGQNGFNVNQPHGFVYFSDDNSVFDAQPFALNSQVGPESAKPSYNFSRFGANVGGPLNIPHLIDGSKWFFFAGWNGTRGSMPYDSFSTVPTLAERSGNFAGITNRGLPVQISLPAGVSASCLTAVDVLNPACFNSAATALLPYIPLPNATPLVLGGPNFHYVTTQQSTSDSVNLRLTHNFGSSSGPPSPGGGPGGGGGGGGRGRRRQQNNINFSMGWQRSSSNIESPFPSLLGNTSTQGLNASAGWVYSKGKISNNLKVNYNHNHVDSANLYTNVLNVAGDAGIGEISTNPFDFALPGINFTNFSGFADPAARRELDQTYSLSETLSWYRGKHNWRFGGDYRRILQSFRSARNAEGGFTFTGFATGFDFSDFLLGQAQQTTLQSGNNSYNFRANSYDGFVQDDWRFRSNLTFNLGVRYEYNGPYTEADNHISNLAVPQIVPGALPVTQVLPGQLGFSPSLIKPDRNNFAPRLGLAWKAMKQTIVRAGYGINYNLAQYGAIIQNFAFQPPFALTETNVAPQPGALTFQTGFPTPTAAITNNFSVDPNYRLGYVQVWNLDIQRTLPGGFLLNVGYNGAKGTRLDTERALPQSLNGLPLTVPNLEPFIYESSEGNSILHAGTVRIRKRMAHGLGFSGSYVFSKSIDDASSIGGGGVIVAQNAFNLPAERGLSAFDQRHKFTGNWMYDIPFGENHRFAQKGFLLHALSGWQYSGDFTIASGLPFSPRVLGNISDLSRGVSGSLRANLGQPVGTPAASPWFNTDAYCEPVTSLQQQALSSSSCAVISSTPFGDAGRNSIEGPPQFAMDMSLSKTITIKETRALELRFQAANVLNTVVITSFNTIVNSQQFGQNTAAGTMRRITFIARFRF